MLKENGAFEAIFFSEKHFFLNFTHKLFPFLTGDTEVVYHFYDFLTIPST